MDTSAFFAKVRAQQQAQNPSHLSQNYQSQPWWQDPELTQSNRDRPTQPMEPVQDNDRDYSRADHLKSKNGNCPNCNSSAFMKPGASAAARCFDCGYIQGREVNDLNTLDVTVNDSAAPKLKVKQTADGGAQKYRARISNNANEIRIANAELEQSFIGKAHVDS